jgi:hypothetical protein
VSAQITTTENYVAKIPAGTQQFAPSVLQITLVSDQLRKNTTLIDHEKVSCWRPLLARPSPQQPTNSVISGYNSAHHNCHVGVGMLAGVVQPRRQVVEGVSPEAPSATSSASSLAALLLLQGASQPWGAKVTCEN